MPAGLLGNPTASPADLDAMRRFSHVTPGTVWHAYQNQAPGVVDLGRVLYLAVGPNCTAHVPPFNYPDMPGVFGWQYLRVGQVNLGNGEIEHQ